MEERDSPPSSLSSRHSHEDDEDKMEAEEFMKYTKDSRAGSPALFMGRDDRGNIAFTKPIKVSPGFRFA